MPNINTTTRTSIVVAHRCLLLEMQDISLVIEGGQIIEQGNQSKTYLTAGYLRTNCTTAFGEELTRESANLWQL